MSRYFSFSYWFVSMSREEADQNIIYFGAAFFHSEPHCRSSTAAALASSSPFLLVDQPAAAPFFFCFAHPLLPSVGAHAFIIYTVDSATCKVSVRQDAQLRPGYSLLCAWEPPPPGPPGGSSSYGTPTGTPSRLLQPRSLPETPGYSIVTCLGTWLTISVRAQFVQKCNKFCFR